MNLPPEVKCTKALLLGWVSVPWHVHMEPWKGVALSEGKDPWTWQWEEVQGCILLFLGENRGTCNCSKWGAACVDPPTNLLWGHAINQSVHLHKAYFLTDYSICKLTPLQMATCVAHTNESSWGCPSWQVHHSHLFGHSLCAIWKLGKRDYTLQIFHCHLTWEIPLLKGPGHEWWKLIFLDTSISGVLYFSLY